MQTRTCLTEQGQSICTSRIGLTQGIPGPSVRRIAEDLKLSRRTVQRALTDLERHGFLERTHRRRPNGSLTSNLYRVK